MDIKQQIEAMSISIDKTIRSGMEAIDRGAMGMALLLEPDTHRLVGLVTDGDIRRALLKGLGLESPLSAVPHPPPCVAQVGTPMSEISNLFNQQIRVVPLLNETGQVVDLAVFDRRMRLPVAEPTLGARELEYVTECILTGWISSSGRFVTKFEEMFADFCHVQYGVATSNGTTALHLALLAVDIGPRDEVIVPTLSFIATANAVTYTGAKAVFVDSDRESWNIDPAAIEAAITPRTKAIIAVHLYGHPADMDPIMEIADRHNLVVIEDAAEAHGALYKGRPVGGIGDVSTFSFYGNKIVTTGEGGIVVTNNTKIMDTIRTLRDHGMSKERRYWHQVLGYNYRMTNLQAAVGVAQMEKIDVILAAKKRIAESYRVQLNMIPGITLPPHAEWADPVCWLYTILVDESQFGISRDQFMSVLQNQGIDSRPVFPPMHLQPIYNTNDDFPVAQWLSDTGVSLPSAAVLQDSDVERVASAIRAMQQLPSPN